MKVEFDSQGRLSMPIAVMISVQIKVIISALLVHNDVNNQCGVGFAGPSIHWRHLFVQCSLGKILDSQIILG